MEIAKSTSASRKYELKIPILAALAFATFGLSAISFAIMRSYESQIAGWAAIVFGFIAIISMIVSGLRRLRTDRISKSKT